MMPATVKPPSTQIVCPVMIAGLAIVEQKDRRAGNLGRRAVATLRNRRIHAARTSGVCTS